MTTKMSSDIPEELRNKIEFEDDAPLELRDAEDPVSKIEEAFAEDKAKDEIQKRRQRMQEKPPPLKLAKKPRQTHRFKNKDYIILRCNICERDMQTARKDDDGNFEPVALCQHVVFKGVIAEQ